MSRREASAAERKNVIVTAAAICLLLLASGLALCWSEHRIELINQSFSHPARGATLNEAAFQRLALHLDDQQKQNSSWAYAALVGIIVVSVVKRALPSPWLRWSYTLLGPASVLLLQAIRAGVYFEQRMAYLSIRATMAESQFGDAQAMLGAQFTCLSTALFFLILFVGSFIIAVVAGRIAPPATNPQKEDS